MTTIVVGSLALDTVETPYGRAKDALGGTAVYFSIAASHFTDVGIVGVVGDDFAQEHIDLLERHGCDLAGLERVAGSTFHWVGRYDQNMNVAHTLDTRLNVFEHFKPTLPDRYRSARTLFLGNIHPELQLDVLDQLEAPEIVALDSMNFWISGSRAALERVMRRVNIVILNEDEARQFSGEVRTAEAARYMRNLGPQFVVIKRGEYGSCLFAKDEYCALPAYPTSGVKDTTGAGDSFAGGFLGYLDRCSRINSTELRRATALGTVMASFTVEDFSVGALQHVSREAVLKRFDALRAVAMVEPLSEAVAVA
jgi:sugar/nucleoside kinase (ribokinase family)